MPTRDNALVVMAKAPEPGKAKTRLAPPLSFEEAAEVARCLLLDQWEHLQSHGRADLFVAFTPAESASWFRENAPPAYTCFPQQGQDLGERMNLAFTELLSRGYRNIVVIGSDLPALPVANLDLAYSLLEGEEVKVVLGPSRDGGYYLVGMNQRTPQIFQSMTWSHDQVLTQTLAKLAALGIDYELLPGWFDIDTVDDLRRLLTCLDSNAKKALKNTLRLLPGLELKGGPQR